MTPNPKSLGSRKPIEIRTVRRLSSTDGIVLVEGPRGRDALGRETPPDWVAVQNSKGERVYVYGELK
jgi:hypothetical protein